MKFQDTGNEQWQSTDAEYYTAEQLRRGEKHDQQAEIERSVEL